MTAKPTHFELRCAERGITSVCGRQLAYEIKCAIDNKEDNKVQFVMLGDQNRPIYRFRVREGRFYAVVNPETNWPMTVLTQEIIRKKKWKRRMVRRGKIANPERFSQATEHSIQQNGVPK